MSRLAHSPVAVFVTGVVILILGLGAAVAILPEWRPVELPPADMFREKADRTVERLNLSKRDRFHLQLSGKGIDLNNTRNERQHFERLFGDRASEWLARHGRTFYVLADTQVENREGKQLSLDLKFALNGDLVAVSGMPNEIALDMFRGDATPGLDPEQVVSALVKSGEMLGEPEAVGIFGSDQVVYPITGSDGEFIESIQLVSASNFPLLVAKRSPETAEQLGAMNRDISYGALARSAWRLATRAGFAIGLVALLAVLIAQRSLGLRNGLLFAAIQFLLIIPPVIRGQQQLFATIAMDLLFLASVFVVFLGWSATESWYRILSNESTTGLDHLRERMVGDDEGRSLLAGWGAGAAISGFLLLMFVVANEVSWIKPATLSVDISALFETGNPWFSGLMVAIAVLLASTVALRWFPANRRLLVTLVLGTLLIVPVVGITPFPITALISVVVTGILMWTLQHYRMLGLLTAALMIFCIPIAAFSLMHPQWQPLELLITGGLSIVPIALGFIGLGRIELKGREKVARPTFLRRLELERRLRYEMDLLTRMQLGLLPDSPPELEGWEISVRSVLPTEVGGDFYEFIEDEEGCLWVAMGDVSGHGYQCSIVHAMTKAALLSLVSSQYRPAAIMDRLDQVLRHSGTARTFVALALMRVDLTTGEIDFSNAASPFPILVTEEGTREIEISTLPLGHGPIQKYETHHFRMPPGSAIVFWSDGLYEARNPREDEYGYERPSGVAHQHVAEGAETIMEAVFSDWTTFRNGEDVEDDTTVLVMKRRSVRAVDRGEAIGGSAQMP